MEVFDALRETDPRTSFGEVYTALERLTWPKYLETRLGEPEPERAVRSKKYYRATYDGTRAYDNSKTASRPALTRPNQKPAPIVS